MSRDVVCTDSRSRRIHEHRRRDECPVVVLSVVADCDHTGPAQLTSKRSSARRAEMDDVAAVHLVAAIKSWISPIQWKTTVSYHSTDNDCPDHAGMNRAVIRKRPGGLKCKRKATARRDRSGIPAAGVRRGCVGDRIAICPRHGRTDGNRQVVWRERAVAKG